MSHDEQARPIEGPFFTNGTWFLLFIMAVGAAFAAWRYTKGLHPVSNLSDFFPWGIWKAVNVAAVAAIGSCGFTLTAVVHVFHREKYHVLMLPSLVMALLCYTFVGNALLVDIGKYYCIWHPMMRSMWQGNSALFEVAMCVMCYMTVLYIEFAPVFFNRFIGSVRLPGTLAFFNDIADRLLRVGDAVLNKVMGLFMCVGIVLCILHQSTLGTIMVIAAPKMHGLWFSPLLPFLFLLSAVAVGLAAVLAVSLGTSAAFGTKYEMKALSSLARYVPYSIGAYLAVRLIDLAARGNLGLMFEGTGRSTLFLVELLMCAAPLVMYLFEGIRNSSKWLMYTSMIFILGISLNRVNTYLTSIMPYNTDGFYSPSIGEISICAAQIAALLLIYRIIVFIFPVVSQRRLPAAG